MATDQPIDTPLRPGENVYLPMAADTIIHAGSLVARDALGRAVPAADTAGLRVVGRAEQSVDNRDGAAEAVGIVVKRGVFRYVQDAGDPVVQAGLGRAAYVVDDETVGAAAAATHGVVAGLALDIEGDALWIDTRAADALQDAAALEARVAANEDAIANL